MNTQLRLSIQQGVELNKVGYTEKAFEYYDYYQDWINFINHDWRSNTMCGIGNAFRFWLRDKGFGRWLDESDKDFDKRGLDIFKRDGSRDLKEDRQEMVIRNETLANLVFSQMNSFASRKDIFDGGYIEIKNPYMKINGNCETANLEYFMERQRAGKHKLEIWKVLSNDNYHVINVLGSKMIDRSNGCIKFIDLDKYISITNMKVLKKYNRSNIGEW